MNEEAILNDISFRLMLLVFCRQFKEESTGVFDMVVRDIREEYVNFFTGDATALPRERAKHFGVDYGENTNQLMIDYDRLTGIEIHCPMFGCDLAGGDWRVVSALIEDIWCPYFPVKVCVIEESQLPNAH